MKSLYKAGLAPECDLGHGRMHRQVRLEKLLGMPYTLRGIYTCPSPICDRIYTPTAGYRSFRELKRAVEQGTLFKVTTPRCTKHHGWMYVKAAKGKGPTLSFVCPVRGCKEETTVQSNKGR